VTWAAMIAELLERSGLSLRAFARELGLSYETVRRWRDGDYEPLLSLAVGFADAVGWSIDVLVGDGPLIGPWRISGRAGQQPTGFPGSLLAIARARDLSLRQLAGQTGIPSGTLLGWTQVRSEPRVGNAAKIAAALELSLHAMATGIGLRLV